MRWLQFVGSSLHFWLLIGAWFYFSLIGRHDALILGAGISCFLFFYHVIIKPAWCGEDGGWLNAKFVSLRTSWRIFCHRKEILAFISALADSAHIPAVELKEKLKVPQHDPNEDWI